MPLLPRHRHWIKRQPGSFAAPFRSRARCRGTRTEVKAPLRTAVNDAKLPRTIAASRAKSLSRNCNAQSHAGSRGRCGCSKRLAADSLAESPADHAQHIVTCGRRQFVSMQARIWLAPIHTICAMPRVAFAVQSGEQRKETNLERRSGTMQITALRDTSATSQTTANSRAP